MKIKKLFSLIISNILILAIPVAVFSSIISTNNEVKSQNKLSKNTRIDGIEYSISDVMDKRDGLIFNDISEIQVATKLNNAPNPNEWFVKINFNESTKKVDITNSYSTKKALWEDNIELSDMHPRVDYENPSNRRIVSNYLNISRYDNLVSNIGGNNEVLWDEENSEPTAINASIDLNTKSSLLLQMSFVPKNNNNIYFFLKSNNKWIRFQISGGDSDFNKDQFGYENSSIETFISLIDNKFKLCTPASHAVTGIGKWEINTDDKIAKTYLSQPIDIAYNKLTKNKQDIKHIVNWEPIFILPSMDDFKMWLQLNESKQRFEFNYGSNNNFKYVFYKSRDNNHIYPYHFDPTTTRPGLTTNIKNNFQDYDAGKSVIVGFNKGTYVKLDEWYFDKEKYPSQISIENIRQQISNHLGNKPSGFSPEQNIILDDKVKYNNAEGYIEFDIVVNYFLDTAGLPVNEEKVLESKVKITGFKTIEPTKYIGGDIVTIDDSNLIASEQNENNIKEFIIRKKDSFFNTLASNIGGNALKSDDIIVNINKKSNVPSDFSNGTGYIECDVSIVANILKQPDALISTPSDLPLTFQMKIIGYKHVKGTSFNLEVNVNSLSNKLATDQTTNSIKDIIVSNKDLFFSNLPQNVESDLNRYITINNIIEKNNLGNSQINNGNSGYVKVSITVSEYTNENGETAHNKTYNLTISGFKKISPTIINEQVTIPGKQNILITNEVSPQNKTADTLKLVKNNFNLFFSGTIPNNLVDKISIVNVTELSNTNKINQLVFDIKVPDYYDNSGNLITNNNLTKRISVKGYKTISPTKINSSTFSLNDKYSSTLSTDISDDKIKEIILDPLRNIKGDRKIIIGEIPPNFTKNNIIIESRMNNNVEGTIKFKVNINLRYDDNGVLVTTPFSNSYDITFNNLKSIKPTKLNSGIFYLDARYLDILASTIQESDIKDMIINPQNYFIDNKKIIEGDLPNNFNQSNILITSEIVKDNINGEVRFNLNINLRYNEKGEVTNSQFEQNSSIVIKGFMANKPTKPTSNDAIVIDPSYKNLLKTPPQNISDIINKHINNQPLSSEENIIFKELKSCLYKYGFEGYKDKYNPNYIDITASETINNVEGSIFITFYINKYMDSNGEIITNGKLETTKKVIGFKRIIPTHVNERESAFIAPFDKYNHIPGEEIVAEKKVWEVIKDYDEDSDVAESDKIILGDLPPDFDYKTDLILTNTKYDPILSRIETYVSLKRYYNDKGELEVKIPSEPIRVLIGGFKLSPSTRINSIELTPNLFYPTLQSIEPNTLEIDINDKSTYRNNTVNYFLDSVKSISNNTSESIQETLNEMIFYKDINNYYLYDDVTSPIIVFNPNVKKTLSFDAYTIKEIEPNFGSIVIQFRAKGYIFNKTNDPIAIEDMYGNGYAYIDIRLSGFKTELENENKINQLYIVLPLSLSGAIICATIIVIIYSMKKYYRKLLDTGERFIE